MHHGTGTATAHCGPSLCSRVFTCAAVQLQIVRRRKWIAPVPVSLLRNVRNTAGHDENVKGNSHVFIDNDDLVFDIVDTEEITPTATSTRGLAAHLTPGSIGMALIYGSASFGAFLMRCLGCSYYYFFYAGRQCEKFWFEVADFCHCGVTFFRAQGLPVV